MYFLKQTLFVLLIFFSFILQPTFCWFRRWNKGREKPLQSFHNRCKRNGNILCQYRPAPLPTIVKPKQRVSPKICIPPKSPPWVPSQYDFPWMGPGTGFTYASRVDNTEIQGNSRQTSKIPRKGTLQFSRNHPYSQTSDDDKGGSSSKKVMARCVSAPTIMQGDLSHCRGIRVGYRCRVLCNSGYEPSRKTIECRMQSGEAKWVLNGARCNPDTTPVCRDNFNRKLDWFVIYRLPVGFNGKERSFLFISDEIPDRDDFFSNAEYDSFHAGRNPSTPWVFDQGLLPKGGNAVAHTIAPVSQNAPQVNYLMYSDQPPPKGTGPEKFGHSKGVLVYNNQRQGFYMYHTLPRFPEVPGNRPEYSLDKGQLFVCVTLSNQGNIDKVLQHVGNLRPNVYANRNINIFLFKTQSDSGTGFHDVSISSAKGKQFRLFSKTNVNGDIYRHIADTCNRDIFVLTWRNGKGGKLGSDCPEGKSNVEHVTKMKFSENEKDTLGYSRFGDWKETTDHSKWLVEQKEVDGLFCATDLNRMGSQAGGKWDVKAKSGGLENKEWAKGRWGGAICLNDRRVAQAFKGMIEGVERCTPTPAG